MTTTTVQRPGEARQIVSRGSQEGEEHAQTPRPRDTMHSHEVRLGVTRAAASARLLACRRKGMQLLLGYANCLCQLGRATVSPICPGLAKTSGSGAARLQEASGWAGSGCTTFRAEGAWMVYIS